MKTLKEEFEHEMWDVVKRVSEVTHYPSLFANMINQMGGVGAAKTLINKSVVTPTYTKLWELGRLELTVEAVVHDNVKWHALFSAEELGRVKKRLTDYQYRKISK